MHVTLIIFSCLAGLCAFGFLMAAAVSFSHLAQPERGSSTPFWLAELLSGGGVSLIFGITRHWRSRRDLRLLTYYGFVALLFAGATLYCSSFFAPTTGLPNF